MTKDDGIRIDVQVSRARADWGVDRTALRRTLVSADGTVRAWDDIAQHYSLAHDLTDGEIAEVRAKAALVRTGTHTATAGVVHEIRGGK